MLFTQPLDRLGFHLAVLALGGCLGFGFDGGWLVGALVFGLLVLPLAGTFKCAAGWPRVAMASYTGAMAVAGILAVILHFIPAPAKGTKLAGAVCLALFVLGAVGSAWVANILIMQRPKR